MKYLVSFCLLASSLNVVFAQVLPGCADEALLKSVRELVIQTNKMPDSAVVQFQDVQTQRLIPASQGKASTTVPELSCKASLTVSSDGTSKTVLDVVDANYGLQARKKNTYELYFMPVRNKKP